MMNEPVTLKHGQIEARLLFCNRAYRDSRHELGNLLSIDELEDGIKQVNFVVTYLYNSYRVCCRNENKPVLIDFNTFDEGVTFANVPATESNLTEVFDKAGETIKVYLSVELDNVKKKIEEISQNTSQPMTNSNNSFAEKSDSIPNTSGTNSTGDNQTTSSEGITNE